MMAPKFIMVLYKFPVVLTVQWGYKFVVLIGPVYVIIKV